MREDGTVEMAHPEHHDTRSQDLEEHVHDAGQFYVGTREAWLEGRPALSSRTAAHVLPSWRVQDIDTPDDWTRAEMLFEMLGRG